MRTAQKSFVLSLMFHALMGSLAFFSLARFHTPPTTFKVSLKHMTLLTRSESSPKQPTLIEPNLPHSAPVKPITPQPPLSKKAFIPQPKIIQAAPNAASPTVPVASTVPLIRQPVENPASIETLPKNPKPTIDTSTELQSFKASLRTKIKQNLHYPSAARRRGMEGEVAVRFTLYDDGSIRGISVQHGEDIFHNAAKAAVASAEGITIPKNLLASLPMEMDLVLEFKLNS